jgi:hypothetical protein
MPDELLTVDIHNDYTLKTIDIRSGAIKTIRQVGGKIIRGPVLIGRDSVSITVETPTGKIGKILKLPNLLIVKSFPAGDGST